MANLTSDVASFSIDDSTGVIADISSDINSNSMEGGQELLEDTGLGDSRRTVVAGLGTATTINFTGWVNSTTEAIWGPVVDGTSITKTLDIEFVTGQHYTGEVWPENITLASNAGELQTVSGSLRAQNGLTRTSVAAS